MYKRISISNVNINFPCQIVRPAQLSKFSKVNHQISSLFTIRTVCNSKTWSEFNDPWNEHRITIIIHDLPQKSNVCATRSSDRNGSLFSNNRFEKCRGKFRDSPIHGAFCAPRKWIKLEARPRRGSARNWSAIDKERSRMKSSIVWPEIYIRLLIYVEIYLFYFYFTYFLKRSKRVTFNALLLLLRLASPI